MGKQFLEQLNPAIKLLVGMVVIISSIIMNSIVLNAGFLLLTLIYYGFKSNLGQDIRKNVWQMAILLLVGCIIIAAGYAYYFELPQIIMFDDYNLSFIYYALKYYSLLMIIIIQYIVNIHTTNPYQLAIALTTTFHLPFKVAYFFYIIFILFKNYQAEYMIVFNAYAMRGMYLPKFSPRVIMAIFKSYRKRIDEHYHAMFSKGYSNDEINFYYKATFRLNELLYLFSYLLIAGIYYFILMR